MEIFQLLKLEKSFEDTVEMSQGSLGT
jgi:hypothetical protein